MTGYDFHPEAETDLDDIWEYVAAANIDAADRVIADLRQALDNLVPFPNQGHRRPDLTSRPLRFKRVRDYLIAYAPDEKPLWVIAVLDGHRSPLDDFWTSSPHREVGVTEKAPLIVPPIGEKVGYFQHPHVRGMWREAALVLKGALRVFCLGYSLPDLDITMRFFLNRNHQNSSTPFFLVDVRDLEAHFRALLPEGVYDLDTRYIKANDPIPSFVENLVHERGVNQ